MISRKRKVLTKKEKQARLTSWFKAQFGKLPLSTDELCTLKERQADLSAELAEVRRKLEDNRELQEMYRAASYVWGMTDKDKKKGGWER